jgi:serine/threonine protein kinase
MTTGMTSEILKDRYLTIQELGSGGFGKTFLAEDVHMPSRRKCVIKQLKAVNDKPQIYQLVQQRFEREAALLEDLGDINSQIPRLYAYFTEDERFYLVEEWIEGQTLNQKLRQGGPLGESVVRELLLSLLPVLEFIQTKGIIHRDIKPDNLIVRAADGLPVLIDFGSVKETMSTIVTASGHSERTIIAGTPGFMPSEQCAGRPVFSSDLYSLGLTAIYLLTGKQPSELESNPHTGEIRWRHFAPHVSENLAAFLDKTILPIARERYINAKVMLETLRSLPEPVQDTIIPWSEDAPASTDSAPPTAIASSENAPASTDSAPPTMITSPSNKAPQTTPPTIIPVTNNNSPETPPPLVSAGMGVQGTPDTRIDNPPVSVGGAFNETNPLPPDLDRWNWGAFMLSTLWPFSNHVWIGLLSWVPFVGIAMPFVLGAKGNAWAWKSRPWNSVEDFKAHQRAWAIAGSVFWGSMLALTAFFAAIAVFVESDSTQVSNNPTDNTTPSLPSNDPSNSQPPTSSTSPSNSETNTPPVINIGNGKTERASEPNAYLDGYWRLEFNDGQIDYRSVLYMNGVNGEMVTEYLNPTTNKNQKVYQTVRLWSSSLGLVVKGYYPLDTQTKQAHPTYQADEILFQQKPNGSYSADNCSAGGCAIVTVEYLGTSLNGNQN